MNKFFASFVVLLLIAMSFYSCTKIETFKELITGSPVTTFNNTQTNENITFPGFNQTETRYLVIDVRYQIQEAWLNVSGASG